MIGSRSSGANGSGKTTLIDLLLGRIEPTSGTAALGASVVVGEIEQARSELLGDESLCDAFMEATGLSIPDARTLLAKFGLGAEHVNRRAGTLSPGERTRASLALLMANGANLLVLDEPTNHLDMAAIEQLEQALDTFAGTVILVTHDRSLLERVRITRTIELHDGRHGRSHRRYGGRSSLARIAPRDRCGASLIAARVWPRFAGLAIALHGNCVTPPE